MTKSKNTKKALLASVLSIIMCMAMLIGSTFAWFTDNVTSGKNKIVAGNLDIELNYKNAKMAADGEGFAEVLPTTENLFVNSEGNDIRWEPGAAAVTYLELKNAGNLALKYQLSVDAADTKTGTDGAALSKVLKTAVVEMTEAEVGTYDRAKAVQKAEAADAESILGYKKPGEMTEQGQVKYLAMIVYFPEEIGNTYEGAVYNRADVELKTELSLNLVATQMSHENDSFGKDYDSNVEYPVTTSKELLEALDKADSGDEILLSKGSYEMPKEYKIAEGVSIVGTPGTVLNVNGGKKDIINPNPETGITQGLLLNNDNITILGVTISGDVQNPTGDQYRGYNALVRITGNNVTLDNVTIASETNDSPIVIANTSTADNTITIKDCKITAAFKAIHIVDGTVGTVVIDGCNIDAVYPISVNTNSQLKLSVKNSVFK